MDIECIQIFLFELESAGSCSVLNHGHTLTYLYSGSCPVKQYIAE